MDELEKMRLLFQYQHPDQYWETETECPCCGVPIKMASIGRHPDGRYIVMIQER